MSYKLLKNKLPRELVSIIINYIYDSVPIWSYSIRMLRLQLEMIKATRQLGRTIKNSIKISDHLQLFETDGK